MDDSNIRWLAALSIGAILCSIACIVLAIVKIFN